MRRLAIVLLLLASTTRAQIAPEPEETPPGPDVLREEISALRRQTDEQPTNRRPAAAWANLHTALRKAAFLLDEYRPEPAVLHKTEQELGWASEALAALTPAGATAPPQTGLLGEGYYSDNDGSYQPFLRYLPTRYNGKPLPLVIFLHGYAPYLDLVNWESLPDSLVDFAERAGFCLAAPFARSNTDFQSIGEQDVMRVIAEMETRYKIDPERIILSGISMGGMGVWTIAGHYPERFAGLLVISGRGDYYFWQGVQRAELPAYKQQLIDAEFGYSLLDKLKRIPTFCIHGTADSLIPVAESRHMVEALRKVNPRVEYVELPDADHWIYEEAFAREDIRAWLSARRRDATAPARQSAAARPPQPVKSAFLDPFLFVLAAPSTDVVAAQRFQRAIADWHNYAKAYPRVAEESEITPEQLSKFNIFLFGEPEQSTLIRQALAGSPVGVEGDHYSSGTNHFPRAGNGLYIVRPSPWNVARRVIVQCGGAWGRGLSPNHKYDFLPEYIIYSEQRDPDGSNTALSAGFFDDAWRLPEARP